jgi:release factor glutamine methyltransferase
MTAMEAVLAGAKILADAGVDSARLDAELLVRHVLGWDRARLYAYPERPLTPPEETAWRGLVDRRSRREPLPYLTGTREFFGRAFRVNPATLIPRPETELLIEGMLRRLPRAKRHPLLVADVGTGSGCIGLTLAAEIPEAILVLTDLSEEALETARENARSLGVEQRVEFRHAAFPSGLDDLAGRLGVLVSNPPYVAEAERALLPPEVRDYEPEAALYAGPDGLSLLRSLLTKGATLLRPGGWIALEFGIGQSEPLRSLAGAQGYEAITIEGDLAGIPRALFARTPLRESRKEDE